MAWKQENPISAGCTLWWLHVALDMMKKPEGGLSMLKEKYTGWTPLRKDLIY